MNDNEMQTKRQLWPIFRDILAVVFWLLTGLALWYCQNFKGKDIPIGIWVAYGVLYLILIVQLGWWNEGDKLDD